MNDSPLEKIARWLEEAKADSGRRNPLAMALASCSADGHPAVRMVLAKGYDKHAGHFTFFSHFASRKGIELAAVPRAAAVMYWEEFGGRQLRIEGPVTRAPDSAADDYFAVRPAASQLNAWVSEQSRPLYNDDLLPERLARKAAELGIDNAALDATDPAEIPRPEHWGGYRLWIEQVEFWTEGAGRFHQRLLYQRSSKALEAGQGDGEVWHLTQLQP